MFHIRIADAEASWVAEFDREQAACYARYGASGAITPPSHGDRTRYIAVMRDGTMVAGIRIHPKSPGVPLPFEAYLELGDDARHELAWRAEDGVAELAGLWSSASVAGTGIGGYVVGAAVAVAPLHGLRHLCSFAHQFNRFTREVGFEPDARVGEHAYPDRRYRSTLNWCDAVELATATPAVRERIFALRAAARAGGRHCLLPMPFQPTYPSASTAP